jgi:acetolactate synthase-1/2/3 large subunit
MPASEGQVVTENHEEEITGAAGVAKVIASMDEPVVLGIPGGHMMSVFDALAPHQDKVRTMLLREESLATVMAEALGRLTSQPAVVMGQGAWVLGNAGIGIMEAHLGSSPMVILIDATEGGSFSHHGPYQSGYGDYGAYDIVNGLRAITKRVFVALDPVQAIQMTQLAVKHSVTGEPGPVGVVFHSRALSGTISRADEPRLYLDRAYHSRSPLAPQLSDIRRAAAALRASKRPVLVAGNGIRLAHADTVLRTFAEQCGIPVATTAAGKGVFTETHPLALGVMGSFGNPTANAAVGDADLIVAVATKLGATDTANENPALIDAHRQKIIQIDVEPLNAGWTYPVDVQIISDAAAALGALAAEVGRIDGDGEARVARLRGQLGWRPELPISGEGELRPRRVAQILAEEVPPGSVMACDAGENRLFMLHDFAVGEGGTLLQPNAGGGMGYAIPAAMAAAVIGDRPAYAVCGDGGFAMTLHGLMSAVENQLRMTVVVFNNRALGWVLHGQGDRPFASSFADFDLAAIAAAIGCAASTVTTENELREALKQSLDQPGTSVIVARTSLEDSFLDVLSSLSGRHPESVEDGD